MKVPGILLSRSAEVQIESFIHEPSHALLLAGPLGIGKSLIAVALAASLLSIERAELYPYYLAVQPDNDSISINQIRELISFFRLKVPGTDNIRRIAVIENADLMGLDAQNALLKVLEEPPTDSVILLTSSRPQALLPTVRSRMQMVQLSAPSIDSLTAFFKEQKYTESDIRIALLKSGTNIAEAKRLLGEGVDRADVAVDLAKRVLSESSYDRLVLTENLSKRKESAIELLNVLATISMTSLQSASTRGTSNVDRWQKILQAVNTAQEALARSGNVKLVLTELMLAI